jgi:hypothetical protein
MNTRLTYSVVLLGEDGRTSLLSNQGRTQWKTKRIALGHCREIKHLLLKGKKLLGAVDVWVEDDIGTEYR